MKRKYSFRTIRFQDKRILFVYILFMPGHLLFNRDISSA